MTQNRTFSSTIMTCVFVLAAALSFAASAGAQTVNVVPVSGKANAGTAARPITNVAAGDSVNGAQATLGGSGNATVAKVGTWPSGVGFSTSTGAVTTSAAVPAGAYNFQYQLCDAAAPTVCGSAAITLTVYAVIVANADTGSASAGVAATPIANVAANDTVNGAAATLGSSGNATVTQVGTWPTGFALNAASGAVTTTAAVPPGTYNFQYQLCNLNSPASCATGGVTVTVNVSIVADPDTGGAVTGLAGTPIANVAANDTINGAQATLGASGNATVAQVGTWPAGISLNVATGAVTTTSSVAIGTYTFQYQLCDLNSPPDCSSATDTVNVTAAMIVANVQTGTADFNVASQPIANIAAGDTVNYAPATLGTGGNATVAKSGTWQTGIGLNPTTGAVSTTTAVPVGTYSIPYQLCDLNSPPDCSTATDTVNVVQANIIATAQGGTADFGIASQPIANVVLNDTVDGAPATLGSGGNGRIGKVGTWQTGIGLNGTTGAVSTTVSVPVGTYSIPYQLCDLATPASCMTATDTVTVIQASIVATAQSGTADFGVASQPIANVAAHDTVDGAAVVLGSGGNATIAKVGTWQTGIGLNPATGAVSTTTAVPTGTYSIPYQLCDLNAPPDCSSNTDTVSVVASSIVAIAQSGTADAGVASQPIANTVANDTVNGAPATLGASGNSMVSKVGTWPAGIGLNPATGAITTTAAVAAGTYNFQYQLCDLNAPPNCGSNTDTVTVSSASIIAVAQSGNADYGIASLAIANVTSGDSVNGAAVILGGGGNATISKVGTWPAGIGLNPTTGAVTTTVTTPDGTYSVAYQLCDLNAPPDCASNTDTVIVYTASILANPQTGTVAAGVGSSNVISGGTVITSDVVNGAAATLGASGNSKISEVGTWPTGFVLNGQTGAVAMSSSVQSGTYDFQYQLCDLNAPVDCAAAPIEVYVTSAIVANPVTAQALAGTAGTVVPSVIATDTINGAKARLQTSPNASVAQSGTWPTGISLNVSTGAVTITAALAPGSYSPMYKLCQLNTSNCAIAPVNLSIDPSVVALSVAGGGIAGTASTAVGNVVLNDTVNAAPATLGSSGNATIAKVGTWPSAIALNTSTGAVTTTSSASVGSYTGQFQVCDKNTPVTCATATAHVSVTQPFVEVPVAATMTGDIEFDWARDGNYCANCNFGLSNSQLNWTDRNNNLWVSGVNAATGMFSPASGRQTNVDTSPLNIDAWFWQDWGNGPEWAFSTPPGSNMPISQLVFTGFSSNYTEPTYQDAGAALATLTGQTGGVGNWQVNFFPGAISPPGDSNNTVLPEASQCLTDPVAMAVYQNLLTPQEMFTEPVNTNSGTVPTLTPFGSYANGIGERWVPCTHWLTFQGSVTIGSNTLQQVFWYDTDTQATQQLTFDPTTKQRAVLFLAPDFPNASGQATYVLMTLAAANQIQIYVQNGSYPNGAPMMQLVNTIYSPDPAEPWMFDPKAFIHCNAAYPRCQTYVVMGLGEVANPQQTESQPSGLGLTNINPANPMFQILVPAQTSPPTQRLDPKYFITSQYGPAVYYDNLTAYRPSANQPYQDNGIFLIYLQLGAPSGPCVGSSAEEGLNSTWPNCTPYVAP